MAEEIKKESVQDADVKKVEATEVKSGKKMNTGIIIAIVVGVLVMLCGCCGIGSLYYTALVATEVAEELEDETMDALDEYEEQAQDIYEESEEYYFLTMIEFYETAAEYYYEDYGYYPESLGELDPDYLYLDQEFIDTYNVVYTPTVDGQSYEITADGGYSYSPATSNYPSEDLAE